MDSVSSAIENAGNYLLTIGVSDIIDIIIVAYLIYKAIMLVRKANSYNLAKGLIVFLMLFLLSNAFKLEMINYILRKAVELGLIVLVILFQPELRRFLERMGSGFFKTRSTGDTTAQNAIYQTVLACTEMAESKTGSLIVFERNISLTDIMNTGTVIDAEVNSELLKNIFFNKAPLHDGAVIIRDSRIAAAGCVLPLTKNNNLSKELGMRHRAALGISEMSDAIVITVSEETGSISLSIDGMLKRHLSPANLSKILSVEMISDEAEPQKGVVAFLKNILKVNDNGDKKDN